MRLLIAEDDKALALFLARALEADGHAARVAHDGAAAVERFREELPDLTILDLNLPVKDGERVLEEIRMIDGDLPVLILTARQDVDARVRCLDRGVDDLMLKPFSLSELRARVRALLRRKRDARLMLRAGDLELSRLDHLVLRGGNRVELTNKEFALLEYLMLHRGHEVSRTELLDSVWKMEPTQTTNIVDVYVNYLRRKLNDTPPGNADPYSPRKGLHDPDRRRNRLPCVLLRGSRRKQPASGRGHGSVGDSDSNSSSKEQHACRHVRFR